MAKDPICNMEIDEQTAEFKSQYGSQTFCFCSEECKEQFELRPELSRLSWKWRKRSSVKIAERTYEKRAQALHC